MASNNNTPHTDPHDHAFPSHQCDPMHPGMSKREYIAAQALQGILASNPQVEYGDHGMTRPMEPYEMAQKAVHATDALINVLNK